MTKLVEISIHKIAETSKTWIVLFVFLGDAIKQLIEGYYHLDPTLAALVAAALGIRAYKEVATAKPFKEGDQAG